MKAGRFWIIVGLAALCAIAFAGCNNGSNDDSSLPKLLGYITDNGGNQVPIYRQPGVPDANVSTALTNAKNAYADLGGSQKINLSGKMKEIWITNDAQNFAYEVSAGKLILKFKYDNPYMDDDFYDFATGTLPGLGLSYIQPANDAVIGPRGVTVTALRREPSDQRSAVRCALA